MSARKVPAAEAVTLGFVSRMVPDAELLTEARVVAQAIAQWSPKHIERLKSIIDRGYAMQLGEALLFEASEAPQVQHERGLALRRRATVASWGPFGAVIGAFGTSVDAGYARSARRVWVRR